MPTITFTTGDAEAQRASWAVGLHSSLKDVNGKPRDATLAEVKQAMANWLTNLVHSYEIQREREKIVLINLVIT